MYPTIEEYTKQIPMIQLFDVQDRKLTPTIHCYALPFLKKVMDLFPDDYIDIYKYVFYLTCPDSTLNPCVNLPEGEKEQWIISELKPTFYMDDLYIAEVVKKCKELYETPILRVWRGAKKMVDKIGTLLDEEELTFGKDGNATDIRGMMKELPTYAENFMKLDTMLKEEQAKVRGGSKVRYDQLPGYRDSKEQEDDDK